MRKILIFVMMFVVLFTGCRADIETPNMESPQSWAQLFEQWWFMMDKSYVFWSLDSPNGEWDDIYDKYMPLMEGYGDIGASDETDKEALNSFLDIIKNLSDGHYSMSIDIGQNSYNMQPSLYRTLLKKGISDEEAKKIILHDSSVGDLRDIFSESDFIAENTVSILSNTFGLDTDTSKGDVVVEYNTINEETYPKAGKYFKEMGYVVSSTDNFSLIVALTHDDILYIAFSGFEIYAHGGDSELGRAVISLMEGEYKGMLKENEDNGFLNGLIVDLRGNTGGNPLNFDLLWSPLIDEDMTIAQIRMKESDNRLSYSGWVDFKVPSIAEKRFDAPVAIITNSASASCSEISTMFFMAFREKYGLENVKTFGVTTLGANGLLDESPSQPYNGGLFVIEPYIKQVLTPSLQTRYIDGTIYEGVGIEPDYPIDFNYSRFANGTDMRFHSAYEWIKAQN